MDSEFRQDLVSGDWILIAPTRGKRTNQFKKSIRRPRVSKKGCDFEYAGEQEGTAVLFAYPSMKQWKIRIILNKYPVVYPLEISVSPRKKGLISTIPGVGHHEVLVTRNHDKNFSDLSLQDAFLIFKTFQDRYRILAKNKDVFYISFFQNWGPTAGASLYHPHYQFAAIPITPPDVTHSLKGSKKYFIKHGECVHCTQINWEKKEKKRIIFENKEAIAFCPFVSRAPFEIRVFPKRHLPFFENTEVNAMKEIAEVLQKSLGKLKSSLNDPDYNFFFHTAPVKNKDRYRYYHWHIEIIPKTSIRAGFEFGTGVEINIVDPDGAAAILKDA